MSVISPWYQLGYVIPHIYTNMDAYQFYRVAPEGMMLVTTGLNLQGHSLEAVEHELPTFWDRVDVLARRKVDRIALSGVPVASMLGRKRMREVLSEAEQRSGLPCDTDLEAHIAVLKHLGATRIALAKIVCGADRIAGARRVQFHPSFASAFRKWSAVSGSVQ